MKRSAKDEAAKGKDNAAKAAAKGKAATVNVPEGKGAAKATSAKARAAKDNKVKGKDATAKATARRGNAAKGKGKAASGSAAKAKIKVNKPTYFTYQNGDKVLYRCQNAECLALNYFKNPHPSMTLKSPEKVVISRCIHCDCLGEMNLKHEHTQEPGYYSRR